MKEIQILKDLYHDNIVKYKGCCTEPGESVCCDMSIIDMLIAHRCSLNTARRAHFQAIDFPARCSSVNIEKSTFVASTACQYCECPTRGWLSTRAGRLCFSQRCCFDRRTSGAADHGVPPSAEPERVPPQAEAGRAPVPPVRRADLPGELRLRLCVLCLFSPLSQRLSWYPASLSILLMKMCEECESRMRQNLIRIALKR